MKVLLTGSSGMVGRNILDHGSFNNLHEIYTGWSWSGFLSQREAVCDENTFELCTMKNKRELHLVLELLDFGKYWDF